MGDLSVVMVSASFHPYVGGAERQALELSAALRKQRIEPGRLRCDRSPIRMVDAAQ